MRGKHTSPDVRTALIGRENADTLLQTLLAHAAVEEIDYTANRLVQLHHKKIGRVSDVTERFEALRVPEILHAEKPEPRASTSAVQTAQIYGRIELSKLILPSVTGKATNTQYISKAILSPTLLRQPEFTSLASFLVSLEALQKVPSKQLERAFRGLLDCYSHRLDAWYTSLATRRLDELRTAHPLGLHIGGYGSVQI